MAPQGKPLCPSERYVNSVQSLGFKASRASTRTQSHQDKLRIEFPGQNVDLSFQVMAATATSQQLFPCGKARGPSRPGTKYPVRGIPQFDQIIDKLLSKH